MISSKKEDEEKRKEFDNIINSINSNSNIEDLSKREEFDSIINSINPRQETPSITTNTYEDFELPEMTSQKENETQSIEDKKWYQKFSNNPKLLEDGYQFGDLTKTNLATITDIISDVSSGVSSIGENVIDIGANLLATAQDVTGHDESAKKTREWANKNYSEKIGNAIANLSNVGKLYNLMNKTTKNPFENSFEENSLMGETTDKIANLVGYTAGMVFGGEVLEGAGIASEIPVSIAGKTLNIPTLAITGGMAGGLAEANSKGDNVTELERWTKGIGSGLFEGVTEGMFGMFGVGGSEITEKWASDVAKKISSSAGKQLAQLGVQASGEAIEEFLSYGLNYLWDNIITNNLGEADFSQKWNWNEVGEEMALAFLSSSLSLGGTTVIKTNEAIQSAEKQLGRNLTQEEKAKVTQTVIDEAIQENENIKFDPENKGENVGNFYVASYTPDGTVKEIVQTKGKEIQNPNRKVNITPIIIKDNQSNTYNIMDKNTGVLIDTTPYESLLQAQMEFNSKMINLDDISIKAINQKINNYNIELKNKTQEYLNQITTEQQNSTIEQNSNQNEDISQVENKTAQNGNIEQTNNNNSIDNRSFEDMAFDAMSDTDVEEVKSPLENRNIETIGKQTNVNAYQYDNPEVKPYFQEMAQMIGEDLSYISSSENRSTTKGGGTKLNTSTKAISTLHNEMGYSYEQIAKGLQNIIEDDGRENNAVSKKLELIIDEQLRNGYTNALGKAVIPNQEYINTIENKGGKENVRAERISKHTQQKINRTEEGKNTRGEKEVSRSNGSNKEKLSKSVQQFQKEQQKRLGKDFKVSETNAEKLTNTEKVIQNEFNNITGLNYATYETNKQTSEDAVFVNNDILIKHDVLRNKKKSNFLPFHELGHWFKVNRNADWKAIYDIIDNTVTKNQIEEYKKILKDKSILDDMSEVEIRDYIIEEIVSDYFGNWANDISNWADMIRNKMLSDDYVQLLIDISDENISTHYNIFGTQEQQEQVYEQINEMMNNFIVENKNGLKTNSEQSINIIPNNVLKKSIEEFKNAKSNVKRENIINIANALNVYHKNNQTFIDKNMAALAGKNLEPKIIKINNTFEYQNKKELRFLVGDYALRNLKNKVVTIKDIQKNVDLSQKGLKKTSSIKQSERTLNSITKLPSIIEEGVYLNSSIDIDDNNIVYHYFYSPVQTVNGNELSMITIKEIVTDKNVNNKFYYHDILEINNEELLHAIPQQKLSKMLFEETPHITNSIAQKNKNVKSNTTTNSNMQKSKDNTIKKSDRTLFDRNNQDLYYDYSEEVKGKNTSTYSNAKMRELIQANDIKQIDNKKQFIRTVIEREGNSYWGNMFKDSTLRDVKYKNEIIQSYLEKQNENNIIVTDSEGRALTKEQQDFYKGNDVVNENGDLQVVYHGTPFGKFTKFNDKNVYFFSVDRGFAEDYAYAKNFEQALDGDVEVMEVYLKAKNVFDPSKESDIQKLREALPEQIRFFATTFDKETFLQRIQRIDDLPPMWTKEQIKNAKFGRVIGDDRYGYNNDIFIGVNKNNEVVYAKHTYGTALEHLTTKEQDEAKEKLLNGEDYVVTIYATPFGQMTEDAIREKYSQLENEQDKRYLADTIRYLDEGKSYMLDDSTYKISPYTASQEAEHLTDIDNWEYIEGSNAWENNEVGKDVIDIIKDLGYDGLKIYEKGKLNYAVFNKNQIKRVDNKKPTNNPDIRYSNRADIDSEGRELSKEQQEFFKDVSSDFKDKNNNILELHHVTDRDFNIFDPNMFGKNTGEKLNGIYMSTEPIGVYGDRDIKVYANVTNPVKSGLKNITKKQYIELLKGHATDSNIENSWHYFKNSDDLTILEKINSLYKSNRNYKNPQEFLNNVMKITGYDGAIYENYANNRKAYVAFNSNQVKRIDNKKPTNNPDIRYSNRYDTEENGEGGFYSQLEKVIEEKMPNTSNAQQIKGIIENSGIKQDEIKWIGLDDYLKQHSLEKISKQQLQDYIKANQINIETVQKGTNKLDEYTEPVKQDIASKNIDIQYILDKYGFDYERDDLIPYKLNGLRAGTVGDFMAENLEKYIDLNDFDKYEKQEDGSFIRTYRDSDGIQWTTQFTEKDFKEDMQKLEDLYDQRTQAEMELSSIEDEYGDYADELGVPKYERYTLNGGTNYKELLYTLPALSKNENNAYEVKNLPVAKYSEYKSPHWEEKNVLAHARTQDFEDVDGNKVLFIDEVQSDLHQEGRKKGYVSDESLKRQQELKEKEEALFAKEDKLMKKHSEIRRKIIELQPESAYDEIYPRIENKSNEEIKKMLPKEAQVEIDMLGLDVKEAYMRVEAKKIWFKNPEYAKLQKEYDKLGKQFKQISSERIKVQHEHDNLRIANKTGISDIFPFKKNWHEFVLRRLINDAVSQGYDEVAWTTGRQQRERYNLAKAIDQIEYEKFYYHPNDVDKGKIGEVEIYARKNGDIIFKRNIKSEELPDYIGKDLATRILNSKENEGIISNLDESVNENPNSGMYLFYDQEIPNYLNKYLKKWNSKVEEITLKDADGKNKSKQLGFKITDEMRNSIKQNGQPLFSNRQLEEEKNSSYDYKIQQKNKEFIREYKDNIKKEDVVTPGATNAQGANRFIEQEIRKVEKTGDWDNSIPITRLTDIRKTIEDYLGLGIKKGHFREKAYGIYKQNRDVIRGKELKDIDNILHETGHALDLGNRLKIDKESIANELLTAIQKHGGYEEETRAIQLEEGFAEVIRTYAIIPEQAKKDYPQSVAVLEEIRKNDKSFDDFIAKVQEQTYNYIHQNPQNRVHSNISVGEQTDKTPLTKAWLKQEIMRNVWDKDFVVKEAVKEFATIQGKTTNQIKASNNAYILTRLASGIKDKALSILSDGYIDENGNKLMPGLKKVGEILGDDPQRYDDLRDYLVARRDTEYKAKTLKTGIRDMDTKYVLNKFKNDTQIQQAAKVIYNTIDGVMQYAVKNGLIEEEAVQSLKESNAFYVPMQRVIEGRGNQTGRKGAVSEIIKKRTGSELDIKDVLENIVANSSNIIQQVENNNVLKALYNQGEEVGLTGSIYDVIPAPMMKVGTANLSMWESELQKQGVNTAKLNLEKTIDLFAPNNKVNIQERITSFINEDGKRVYLQFDKECVDLFNALMNLDGKTMSFFLKINARLNMPLRYGATMANIGFAIPNMISDTAQAAIFSNAGFIPVVDNALGVLDILTATNKHVRNFVKNYSPEYVNRIENMYNLYRQSGATSSTRMSQFRDSTQSNMKDIYGTKNSETLGIHEKWKPLKRLLDIMTYIPEISEQSTRFRVFERNYDMYKSKGNSEIDARILAALESRDATQDFGRTGNLTREINQLIPFSAARVGSAYTFAEKIKANPKQTSMRIALLTALAMAIKAIGYDDDEIEELNQRKKDDNFVLKIGDHVVTIKKPQGILRSMINLAEYIQDLATGHIDEGKEGEKLGQWIHNTLWDNLPADSIGSAFSSMPGGAILENWANKDFYYNTDIVKSYDLDLPDSEQYYDYNSQLAILLGKAFNYSPAKIDNLISGYFAGLGTQVTNIMDYVSGKIGLSPEKPEMGAESNAIGKRFIVNVNTNSASIDEVYNRKTELTKKQNGGTITADEETELETLKGAITNLSKVNKQIKEIKADLTTSGKEKAEQIKVLQQQKTDIARQALGKDLIHSENASIIETTSFYPTNSSLSKNNYKLELSSEMKKEYAEIAQEYYSKYESQGLYSQDKLQEIKTKAKEYAKNSLMQKYRSQLVKTK